jgi:CHAP domain
MVVRPERFPRPLYPPDANTKGKTPSPNGPDAEAYKRAMWRGGRWPGPASNFDRTFSNAFSHGKSGNVSESGIAGFQRQTGLDDSGWIGQQTFEKICASRIPGGLPNAGQPLLDVQAQNLLAEAYTMFGGADPIPSKKTTREKALAGAIRHLGYKEYPPGTNNTKFGEWYGVNYQPWCAIFATYCFEIEAGGSPSFQRGVKYAYVPYMVQDARAKRNGLSIPNSPLPGDIVAFDWGRDGTYDHVGIFEKWAGSSPSSFTAIEGNTSTSSNSNGGSVMRRSRDTRNQATVFIRVA